MKIILSIFVFLSLNLFAQSLDESLQKYSKKLLSEIKMNNQSYINKHLFSPPNMSIKYKEMDTKAVDEYFKIIHKHLGDLKSFSLSKSNPSLLDFGISKGNASFWKENTQYVVYKYKAKFEKNDDVWIDLYFFPYKKRIHLSRFVISIKEDKKETMNKMTKELFTFAKKLIE